MRPNYHPEGLFQENKVAGEKPNTQLWHVNGRCPEDTIPVRRTKKDDILRASSVKRYGRKKQRTIPKSADPDLVNESGHQVKIKALKESVFDCNFIGFLSLAFLILF